MIKRLLRRSNSEGELFPIPSPFCCLGFRSISVPHFEMLWLRRKQQFKEKVFILLSFWQGGLFGERGKYYFFLSVRFSSFLFWVFTYYCGFCVFQSFSSLISFPRSLHFNEFSSPKHLFHSFPVTSFHDLFGSVFISTSLPSEIHLIPGYTWIFPVQTYTACSLLGFRYVIHCFFIALPQPLMLFHVTLLK